MISAGSAVNYFGVEKKKPASVRLDSVTAFNPRASGVR
jgi:hypothetical protein